jgi:KaiC/GvpD/RAD55 family RecA-like ATPase
MKNFIETRALKILTEDIMENNLLTVIGNPGTGKTYLIHHVALQLQSMNYEILPVY